MPLTNFEQDPGAPPGTGWFSFDDGRRLHAKDPELAATVGGRMTNQGFQSALGGLNFGGQPGAAPQQPPPAVPPPQPGAPPAAGGPPPATGGGPPPPEGQGLVEPQKALTNYVNAPVYSAPTKGGVRNQRISQTTEQEGLPYDQGLAEQRADANIGVMMAHQATAEAQQARAQAEALHWQSQIPELQKKAAQAQVEQQEQQDAYKRERAELQQLMTQSQQDQKRFNANRWMESKGAVGQIGAVIAQAFGAYAATLSHGQNWAKQIIDGYIDRDIQSQKEQIESGKAGVNNALQKLNLRFGDMNQAQAALKLAMSQSVDAQVQAYAAAAKSDDAKLAAQQWLADNQKDRVAEEQKFMAASMGKRKTETSGQVVAPSAGGYRAPTEGEKQSRLKTIEEGQRVGAMPDTSREGRKLDIEEKRAAAKEKNNPATAKAQEQLNAIDSSLRNAEELNKLYAQTGPLTPAQRGRLKYLQDVSPLETHKALTGLGRFSAEEGKRYESAYGSGGIALDPFGKRQAALGALREDLARKKAQIQQQLASGVGAAESEDIKDVE